MAKPGWESEGVVPAPKCQGRLSGALMALLVLKAHLKAVQSQDLNRSPATPVCLRASPRAGPGLPTLTGAETGYPLFLP